MKNLNLTGHRYYLRLRISRYALFMKLSVWNIVHGFPEHGCINVREGPLLFYWGGGGGGTIFGTCRQFVSKSNAFQTIFSLHFVITTIF